MEENLMELKEEKSEQPSHGKMGNTAVIPYMGPTGKEGGSKKES